VAFYLEYNCCYSAITVLFVTVLVNFLNNFVVQGTWSMAFLQAEEQYRDLGTEVLQQISWRREVLAG